MRRLPTRRAVRRAVVLAAGLLLLVPSVAASAAPGSWAASAAPGSWAASAAPGSWAASAAPAADDPPLPTWRAIRFPVEGAVRFRDDFGAPRDGGARSHEGNDLFGDRLQPVVAAAAGRVVAIGTGAVRSGNSVTIAGDDGWRYLYIHLNNDSPGTDDGAAPRSLTFGPGIAIGARVGVGQLVGYLGDSGNAEEESPQLHFEIRTPANVPIDPYTSLRLADGRDPATTCTPATDPLPTPASGAGYWLVASDGGVFAFGDAGFFGSTGGLVLNRPIVGMASTPSGAGYWLVASDGGVFAFGDAGFFGSTGGLVLNRPIVGMASTPSGAGYWLVASDGGVFAFGDAGFFGSTGALVLNRPIIGMASTPSAQGYRLVGSDGGVFAFGDAGFAGAAPSDRSPARGLVGGGSGYRVVRADGTVEAYGGARFVGSLQTSGLCAWPSVVGLGATGSGGGYWLAGRDGSVAAFGDAADRGDLVRLGVTPAPIVGFAVSG